MKTNHHKLQSNSTPSKRPAGRLVTVLALAAALLAQSEQARGDQIFVAVNNGFDGLSAIGEYNLNGTPVNASLFTGLYAPQDMVVSGSNLFIIEASANNSIGEYTTSGTTVNATLITGLNGPSGLAISGTNLFVGNSGSGTIGEFTTSGATVHAALVSGLTNPVGVAVSGTNLFVLNNGSGTIGEYTTSGVTVHATLVSNLTGPYGIAASGLNLFVVNSNGTTISEYTTSGATVNAALVSGLDGGIERIAVGGSELFVNDRTGGDGGGKICEFTLGATPGTLVSSNMQFISGLYEPNSVAVAFSTPAVSLAFCPLLTITGVVGDSYIIQSSTNLSNPNGWITLTNLTLTQTVQPWADTSVEASSPFNPQDFYQVSPAQ